MNKKLLAVAMIGLVSFAGAVNAKTVATPKTTVTMTSTSSSAFGGCLAKVAANISTAAPLCPGSSSGSFVVFSCNGALQDADSANKLFESMQMAHMLGKTVQVYVDDAKKQNGYCLVNRVDII